MQKKILSYLGPAIAILLLLVSVVVITGELKNYSLQDVAQSFGAISTGQIGMAIALTFFGFLAMTGYDALAFRHLKVPLAYRRIALTTFISIAFSNVIGFAIVTGSAIRYRRYSAWGVSGWAIAHVIAFANFSFLLGLFALGSLAFLYAPLSIPAASHLPFTTARPLGGIFLSLTAAYLASSLLIKRQITLRQFSFRVPALPIALSQIAVSSLDWGLATAVLYTLVPTGDSYFSFLNIYLLAMAAGVASSVPGGVGVFETVMILLLADRVPGDAVLAALLAYRIIYYLLPFAIAAILLAAQEFLSKPDRPRFK